MSNLVERIKAQQEAIYQQFVKKYGKRIDEKLEEIFIKHKCPSWTVKVPAFPKRNTFIEELWFDEKLSGGGLNNLLRYCKEQGFSVNPTHWSDYPYTAVTGFEITC